MYIFILCWIIHFFIYKTFLIFFCATYILILITPRLRQCWQPVRLTTFSENEIKWMGISFVVIVWYYCWLLTQYQNACHCYNALYARCVCVCLTKLRTWLKCIYLYLYREMIGTRDVTFMYIALPLNISL